MYQVGKHELKNVEFYSYEGNMKVMKQCEGEVVMYGNVLLCSSVITLVLKKDLLFMKNHTCRISQETLYQR